MLRLIGLMFFVGFFQMNVHSQTCKNITLLDRWFSDTLTTNSSLARYSGCWGFEWNQRSYAAIGSTEGTHFFEIRNDSLRDAGFIEGRYNSSFVIHREFKTFGHYGYAICDEGNSSLQVIDLQYLPDSVVLLADIQDERIGNVHNLFIDSTHKLLFACMVTPIVNNQPQALIPLRVFSIADPVQPLLLWEGPTDIPEVHDCYVRDAMAYLNCGMDGLRVYNFENPSIPVYLNNLTFYPDQGYNHQGWLSPDGNTYVFVDETSGKRIKKCSVNSNYTLQIDQLFGTNFENNAVPHNLMCSNELLFAAYYNEGLRIYNIQSEAKEIAHYDTYPQESAFNMNGAWGVYADYTSNHIIVSDRQNGLFLFHFPKETFQTLSGIEPFAIYPNPCEQGEMVSTRSFEDEIINFSVEILSASGQQIKQITSGSYSTVQFQNELPAGVYVLQISYENYLGEDQRFVSRLLVL
jgi:choice-of-anchor B domain-containing protein